MDPLRGRLDLLRGRLDPIKREIGPLKRKIGPLKGETFCVLINSSKDYHNYKFTNVEEVQKEPLLHDQTPLSCFKWWKLYRLFTYKKMDQVSQSFPKIISKWSKMQKAREATLFHYRNI